MKKPKLQTRDFPNTRAAMLEYDIGEHERNAAWDRAKSKADIEKCEAQDLAALRKVQDAFHKDTSDINSLSHCRIVGLNYLRTISQKTMKTSRWVTATVADLDAAIAAKKGSSVSICRRCLVAQAVLRELPDASVARGNIYNSSGMVHGGYSRAVVQKFEERFDDGLYDEIRADLPARFQITFDPFKFNIYGIPARH